LKFRFTPGRLRRLKSHPLRISIRQSRVGQWLQYSFRPESVLRPGFLSFPVASVRVDPQTGNGAVVIYSKQHRSFARLSTYARGVDFFPSKAHEILPMLVYYKALGIASISLASL
jgi:hypothetical protein